MISGQLSDVNRGPFYCLPGGTVALIYTPPSVPTSSFTVCASFIINTIVNFFSLMNDFFHILVSVSSSTDRAYDKAKGSHPLLQMLPFIAIGNFIIL